eukprot:scaffold35913_cov62-Attheya_sp.AAC.5
MGSSEDYDIMQRIYEAEATATLQCDGGCEATGLDTTCVESSTGPSPTPGGGGDPTSPSPDKVCTEGTFSCPNSEQCCTTNCIGSCTVGDNSNTLTTIGGGQICLGGANCIPSTCSFTCDSGCTCSNSSPTGSPTISSSAYYHETNTNVIYAGLMAISTLVISSSCL